MDHRRLTGALARVKDEPSSSRLQLRDARCRAPTHHDSSRKFGENAVEMCGKSVIAAGWRLMTRPLYPMTDAAHPAADCGAESDLLAFSLGSPAGCPCEPDLPFPKPAEHGG